MFGHRTELAYDESGGKRRVVMEVEGNNYTCVQRLDYYPFGLPFDDCEAPERQPYKFGGEGAG